MHIHIYITIVLSEPLAKIIKKWRLARMVATGKDEGVWAGARVQEGREAYRSGQSAPGIEARILDALADAFFFFHCLFFVSGCLA